MAERRSETRLRVEVPSAGNRLVTFGGLFAAIMALIIGVRRNKRLEADKL